MTARDDATNPKLTRPSSAGRLTRPTYARHMLSTRVTLGQVSEITHSLRVSARAVEKHIASIFLKLDLPPDTDQYHRRVMAVVRYLDS